ncbi:MAG: YdeI/OmpD-associated family protein, partial [Nocardioidaceae bacterium]|nr:YdeI/OmpD-associated family protein [Nocardioidaceae bacterium]
ADVRAAAGVAAGDTLDVEVVVDTAPRQVEVPADLASALDAVPAARKTFDGLSVSLKKYHVTQVTGAKTDETRQRRIEKAVAILAEGRAR